MWRVAQFAATYVVAVAGDCEDGSCKEVPIDLLQRDLHVDGKNTQLCFDDHTSCEKKGNGPMFVDFSWNTSTAEQCQEKCIKKVGDGSKIQDACCQFHNGRCKFFKRRADRKATDVVDWVNNKQAFILANCPASQNFECGTFKPEHKCVDDENTKPKGDNDANSEEECYDYCKAEGVAGTCCQFNVQNKKCRYWSNMALTPEPFNANNENKHAFKVCQPCAWKSLGAGSVCIVDGDVGESWNIETTKDVASSDACQQLYRDDARCNYITYRADVNRCLCKKSCESIETREGKESFEKDCSEAQ
jgi:hypothetical protein